VDESAIQPPALLPGEPPSEPPSEAARQEPPGPPTAAWSPWTAPAALVSGILLAAVGGLLVDIPALALGVKVSASHVPPGLEIVDTVVQDGAFVLAAVFFAQLGGRTVAASQFGLRPTPVWRATRLVVLTLVGFLLFSLAWSAIVHAPKEKLLEQLGAGEGTLLLLLSAALTCVVAPICEELLFRGFIFTALRNWRGVWPAAAISGLLFGAVHAGSAPAVDLVPLAALGFGLCLLYRVTGSLYPCIVAHSLNNSLAFGSLEGWGWQIPVLMAAALVLIGLLALALMRAGVISSERPLVAADALAIPPGG
jgi:membrane protease YdiL (CAAX protease family)